MPKNTQARTGLVYDSGALIAADRNERRMWAIHQRALARGARPVVPAGCLIEVSTGGQQANLARLLEGCMIEPLTADAAKQAGSIRARARSGACAIDASVVEVAQRLSCAIVTSDRDDIESLNPTKRRPEIIDI